MWFREKQQLLICTVAVVMVSMFVLLRYLPLQRRIKAVEKEKAEHELVLARSSTHSKELPLLTDQLLKLLRTVENYEANVPGNRDLGVFLQSIADLMNQHGLGDQLVEPGAELQVDKLNCIPVSIRCKGKLGQIFEFFKSLQALDRLVRIEQVELENGRSFGGELSMKTKAIVYYRPQTVQG